MFPHVDRQDSMGEENVLTCSAEKKRKKRESMRVE